jgi:riboflavin-specific deaminase-like protein
MGIPRKNLREARLRRKQPEHPLRLIVSGRLQLSRNLKLLRSNISPILFVCTEQAPPTRRKFFAKYGRVLVCGSKDIDLKKLIRILQVDYQVKTLLCEGGPTLNDAFFRAHLVDELYLTLCPKIFGGNKAPTLVDGKGVMRLRDMDRGRFVSLKKGRSDWFLKIIF